MKTKVNGSVWRDTNGDIIHAHGGCILYFGEYYYWYGENREQDNYVSCYRSKNLHEWEFRNNVITMQSKTSNCRMRTEIKLNNNGKKVNLERPKVIYNKKTGQFVMWMHYENGINYTEAACAVAVCDAPDGDFVYYGHFRPLGYMSRDCTLFQEKDGTAYFISTARDNADIHIYRLQDDYINIDSLVNILWPGEYREAPSILERNGIYYMLTSYCTGWKPNQGKYAISEDITGKWSSLENFGNQTTFDTQPTFVLPIKKNETVEYIYIGDRWNESDYAKSTYVFLKLSFNNSDGLYIDYQNSLEII